MRILSKSIFREIVTSALLGGVLFTFVLFLHTMEKLFALLVRSTAPPFEVTKLLLFALPATVPFALPLGVLVGILIGLSRMSSDGEITAMRAAGVPSSSVLRPVVLFAVLALLVTALTSLWLSPLCLRRQSQIARRIAAAQLTADIEARVFDEQFPNTVLYLGDVATGKQVHWSYLFMADTTPPEDLAKEGKDRSTDSPRVTVAADAIATPDVDHNQIQLNMRDVRTIELDKEGHVITTGSSEGVQVLQAQKPDVEVNHVVTEMDTVPLYRRTYKTPGLTLQERKEAAIELHQRLALPFACLLLALVGVPLGISSRKGGKSTAFVVTVLVAFVYYLSLITLIRLARKGNFPVPIAAWTPNVIFALLGAILISRLERPGDKDFLGWMRSKWAAVLKKISDRRPEAAKGAGARRLRGFGLRPMLVDGYVLNSFLFYFAVLLAALVMMTEVFTFFELLSDMVKNNISMFTMLDYLFNLAPQLIYESTPMAVLVATLICFGVLTNIMRSPPSKPAASAYTGSPFPCWSRPSPSAASFLRSTTTTFRKLTAARKPCAPSSRIAPSKPICARTASGLPVKTTVFTTTNTSTPSSPSCTGQTYMCSTRRRFMWSIRFRRKGRAGSPRCTPGSFKTD